MFVKRRENSVIPARYTERQSRHEIQNNLVVGSYNSYHS